MKNLIVFCANKNYIEHVKYNIRNVYDKHGKSEICIIIDKKDRVIFEDSLSEFDVFFFEVDSESLEDGYTLKYHIFDTFFKNWDNILYLDCDTVIYDNLNSLFDMSHQSNKLFMSNEEVYRIRIFFQDFVEDNEETSKLFVKLNTEYPQSESLGFNSGIILFDTSVIDETSLSKIYEIHKEFELINNHGKQYPKKTKIEDGGCGDQPIINLFFYDKIQNVSHDLFTFNPSKQTNNTLITHFTRYQAPWKNEDYCDKLGSTYNEYYMKMKSKIQIKKQTTIIVTGIYSNLWGTEFGGRPSRQNHYRLSLLSILKMNPDKVICFTNQEELQSLEEHFYNYHGIDNKLLEFKVFDLRQSKYFEKISSLKNVEQMKTFDRCFEIQYNKFFWTDSLFEIYDYDRVYWFDAGLSHGGLFPDEFAYGNGYERHYNFNLFNPGFLEKINILSENKFLIVCKNNSGGFYWSQTIPEKYYTKYKKDYHAIGGFFGGEPNQFRNVSKDFDSLLFNLLKNESDLFMEEQIMSCLYYNNEEDYHVLKFDDWYKKEWHDENTSFFYEIFLTNKSNEQNGEVVQEKLHINNNISMENTEKEIVINKSNNICVTAVSIQNANNIGKDYSVHAKRMAESYLEHTDFDVVIVTDNPKSFQEINNDRLKIIDYDTRFDERKMVSNFFNYHLKRYAILVAKELNYQTILYVDCDCYIVGWDMESFLNKLNEDFDMAFVTHAHPQLGDLRRNYKHFQDKIDLEFEGLYYDLLDMAPNPAETHVLIKNNEKLTEFLEFWDKISKNNKHNNPTYHDGVYFGTSGVHAKMNMIGVDLSSKFTEFCRISHGDGILNFFGHKIS